MCACGNAGPQFHVYSTHGGKRPDNGGNKRGEVNAGVRDTPQIEARIEISASRNQDGMYQDSSFIFEFQPANGARINTPLQFSQALGT